ncbi:MAG: hypothetical protein FJ011_10680 [Chloroflexi bacterium]|nr:hypothetical protein [Chloroflexota bacterium]
MHRGALTSRGTITTVLILQFIPLILFPPESFSPTTQEWWLPILLAVLVLIADFQLLVRRSSAAWPWYLSSFSQGFNIISRLMMLWSHATKMVGKESVVNWPYILLTGIAIALSVGVLWYNELPEVRQALLRTKPVAQVPPAESGKAAQSSP